MPGRRRLTVPNPEDWSLRAEQEICRLCEGAGSLAKNFGVESVGELDVIDCPNCEGSGQGRKIVILAFTKGSAELEVSLEQGDFFRWMKHASGVWEALVAQGEEGS